MQNRQTNFQLFLYLLCIFLIILGVGLLKRLSIFVANEYLYSIPILGEILQSIEIGELVNIIVFAVLGLFIGVSTYLYPQQNPRAVSSLILIISVPLLFTLTSWVRYHEWLTYFSIQEKILVPEATQITNTFLNDNVGVSGFPGFYLYTGKYPVIPSNREEMKAMVEIDQKVKGKFTQFLNQQADLVTFIYTHQGWLIRGFYFAMTVVTAVYHFQVGLKEAEFLEHRRAYRQAQTLALKSQLPSDLDPPKKT